MRFCPVLFYLVPGASFSSSSASLVMYWCMPSKSVGFFSMTCLKLAHCLTTAASSELLEE